MRLGIRRTNQFKRDVKRMLKRGKTLEDLLFVINELVEQCELADKLNTKIMLLKASIVINGIVTLSRIGFCCMPLKMMNLFYIEPALMQTCSLDLPPIYPFSRIE